jgi:hypothetical protein
MKLILLSKGILTVLSVVSQAVELVVSTTENHEHVTPTPHLLVERDQVIIGGTFLGYYSTIDLGTTSCMSSFLGKRIHWTATLISKYRVVSYLRHRIHIHYVFNLLGLLF